MKYVLILLSIFFLISCSDDSSSNSCNGEIISLNKKYEIFFNQADSDLERHEIIKELWLRLDLTTCIDDSCNGKVTELNDRYRGYFESADGDLRHENLLIQQMWGNLNKLSCY